jgi:hypothetical protein
LAGRIYDLPAKRASGSGGFISARWAQAPELARKTFVDYLLDGAIFVLFAVLLVPAFLAGWVVRHESGGGKTKTVTVSESQAAESERAAI